MFGQLPVVIGIVSAWVSDKGLILRIVFMGTPEFAVTPLEHLLLNHCPIDRPAVVATWCRRR
jgi:hypothetical protein